MPVLSMNKHMNYTQTHNLFRRFKNTRHFKALSKAHVCDYVQVTANVRNVRLTANHTDLFSHTE